MTHLDKIKEARRMAAAMGLSEDLAITGYTAPTTKLWLEKFITVNPHMIEIKKRIGTLSHIDKPVLILGETGTGKEILANALHGARGGRFVPINITSLSDDLLMSELFGHERGAFTGASNDKTGLFQEAKDGTIFLDEIGDMPLNAQAKILRALQEGKGRKVGSTTEYNISARLVCATHRDIKKLVGDGLFREDLYYRISTFEIRITPLRERPEDIDEILSDIYTDSLPIEKLLPLKGNVRELQNIVDRVKLWGLGAL